MSKDRDDRALLAKDPREPHHSSVKARDGPIPRMVLLVIEEQVLWSLVITESFCLCKLTHVFVVGPVSLLAGSVTVGDAKAHAAVLQLCSMRGELLAFRADTLVNSRLGKRVYVPMGLERFNKNMHISDGGKAALLCPCLCCLGVAFPPDSQEAAPRPSSVRVWFGCCVSKCPRG